MSSTFEFMNAVLVALEDCGEFSCSYEAFVSMGRPIDPSGVDCNSLAVWARRETPVQGDRPRKCGSAFKEEYGLRLTKCCGSIDTSVETNLNSGFEDALVKCFYDDAEALKCCLLQVLPGAVHEFKDMTCNRMPITGVIFDSTVQGQCMGVDINFYLVRDTCCDDPPE